MEITMDKQSTIGKYWNWILIGTAGVLMVLTQWVPFWLCAMAWFMGAALGTHIIEIKNHHWMLLYHTNILANFASQIEGMEVEFYEDDEEDEEL